MLGELAHLVQGRVIVFLEPCRKWLKSGSTTWVTIHRVPAWRMDKIGFGARLASPLEFARDVTGRTGNSWLGQWLVDM
jgi:hypothetical protein